MISLRQSNLKPKSEPDLQEEHPINKPLEKKEENAKTEGIYQINYSNDFIFIKNKNVSSRMIKIDRRNMKSSFEVLDEDILLPFKSMKSMDVFAVWGIVEILDVEFLILISKARVAVKIDESKIYEVLSVKFVTVDIQKFNNMEFEKCWEQLTRLKEFLKTGFYFSYSYPLCHNFEGQIKVSQEDLTKNISQNFFGWNYRALKQLLSEVINGFAFFIPIIQGFVGKCDLGEMKYILISRRSYIMGGTRFNNRGIDNFGRVANFVESEALLQTKNGWYSFVQIRGSLPFYWDQFKGVGVNIKIDQSESINCDILMKHFELLGEEGYNKVVMLNLLSLKRPEENRLIEYFQNLLVKAEDKGLKNVEYEYFDFLTETKETDHSAIDKEVIRMFRQLDLDMSLWNRGEDGRCEAVKKQSIFVRTNCLDCLDRTNAAQSKLALFALSKVMAEEGQPVGDETKVLAEFEGDKKPWFKDLRSLWANNGDAISIVYSGTGATTSSVTRKGQKSSIGSIIDHGFKTLNRLYLNNFDDDYKQDVIDMLLAKKTRTVRLTEMQNRPSDSDFDSASAQISFVSFTSIRNNSNVAVKADFAPKLFTEFGDSSFVVVVFYIHTDKPLILDGQDHLVFPTFARLFRFYADQTTEFKMVREFIGAKFECLLFEKTGQPHELSFFKAEMVPGSLFSSPIGCQISIIFRQISVKVFAIKVDGGFFSGSPSQCVKTLLAKSLDRRYDTIVFMGPMEVGVDVETAHRDYFPCLNQDVENAGDKTHNNRLFALLPKTTPYQVVTVPASFETIDFKGILTLNGCSLIIK